MKIIKKLDRVGDVKSQKLWLCYEFIKYDGMPCLLFV